MTFKRFLPFILSLIVVLLTTIPMMSATKTEILWDSWGVPHIFSNNSENLFKAFGWAQTHSHGNLILRLYGQARGRAAEYWGKEYLTSDQYVRLMGIPKRAQQWYDQQNPEMRGYLDAFARGINEYVKTYPDRIDEPLKAVLPVTGVDILAHLQRVIYFHFLANPQQVASLQTTPLQGGSNGWAIAPSNSTNGKAMLLANPHLPWGDLYLWYEAHLNSPNVNTYGATLVGMPVLAIAFNDHLGWTVTVNPTDGADIYQLTLKDGGYLFDGKVLPFESETETMKIRQSNGTYIETSLSVKSSVHGVVIAEKDDRAYALRVVGLDRPDGIEQMWQMGQAKTLKDFETALKPLQLPLFNIIYADRQGNIFYLFNALVPIRSTGDWDYWQKIVPGDTSTTLWTDYHPYQDLPRLVNPPTGWLQNTNDPPWSSTYPPVLAAQNYPSYLTLSSLGKASNIFRTQRSIKLLLESEKISFEEMIDKKFSSRLEMADRLLEYLIPAARLLANPIGLEAAEVLEKWDRQTNPDSQGAALFVLWAFTLEPSGLFSRPWNEKDYLNTPTGIADFNTALAVLEGVAAQIKLLYGRLDVPWGEVARMRYGDKDLPANGGPGNLGSFQVLNLGKGKDERFQVIFGDTYIAAIEFSDPVKAKALMVYGNATQPSSSHLGDQLLLYSQGKMRPVWRTRQAIEDHLEFKEEIS
ncbi:Glutaryl-7-aminocephalosporanic-acid acylase [Gloeothece citriformis PCC 7424]|uniref:Glutaryl-7-aminocephalosporanic-acid acylase n=1 Tax=Gloeothece citriformis (strain PCC 7424) TaxID=65393 RepID=B7KEM5_GLOC7|nr:acylase [Gloeothece citriformis]ACK69050.1 Glutaryl-7-aminocephalosporanic-acid acylase [Gloeothece citriformis PCC 7424]